MQFESGNKYKVIDRNKILMRSFEERTNKLSSSEIRNDLKMIIAQSAGAVEYTDCFSAEG